MRRSLPILGLGLLLGCGMTGIASAQVVQPYPANPPPPGYAPPAPLPGTANGTDANGSVGPGSQASPNRIVNGGMGPGPGMNGGMNPGPNGDPNGTMASGDVNGGFVGAPASSQPNPENCGTPDAPHSCPPLPKNPLKYYPANKS